MERFGDGPNGLYFTLRSHSRHDEAIVIVDVEALGVAGRGLEPKELLEGRELTWDVCDGMVRIVVPVTFSETLVLSLTSR